MSMDMGTLFAADTGSGADGHPVGARAGSRPEVTAAVTRGVARHLHQHGQAVLLEFPLANGRRADLFGLGQDGRVTIVEVKSSREDFQIDAKWPEYQPWCDELFFAVDEHFPRELLPCECGLIVADAYGGAIIRRPAVHKLAPARRKALMIRAARLASQRLHRLNDPDAPLWGEAAF